MNLALRRSKMISFRLSPEEYQRFRHMCAERGVRSISDLARTALQKLVAAENDDDPLSYEVRDLRQQVESLSHELDRITQLVEGRKAAAGG